MMCLRRWICRMMSHQSPPTPNDEQIRLKVEQVRELDKQHREAFEHLLTMFTFEVSDREHKNKDNT